MRAHLAAALGAAVACSATGASADPDTFRPALDTRGYVTVDGGEVLGRWEPSFGIVTSWARGGMTGAEDVVQPTLVAAIGAPFGFELAASLPFSVISASGGMSTQEVGDLALDGKLRLWDRGRWAAAVAGGATVAGSGEGRAIVEWRGEKLRVALEAGLRGRAPAGGIGASWALGQKLDAILDINEHEVTAGLRVRLAPASHFTIGAGTGFAGGPELRAFGAIVFEPRAGRVTHTALPDGPDPQIVYLDHDGDVTDVADPDPDTDGDTIHDSEDLCIEEKGPASNGGCPERDRVVTTDTAIVTLQGIEFEFDSDVIREGSYATLDDVAQSLEQNPDIRVVEIGGHTDARGSASYNLDLSQRRADSVRRYLIADGIAADRLTAVGHGETRPAVKGTGERVWEKNRRVEFQIKVRRSEEDPDS